MKDKQKTMSLPHSPHIHTTDTKQNQALSGPYKGKRLRGWLKVKSLKKELTKEGKQLSSRSSSFVV